MVVGHWFVIASGAFFDPISNEPYNMFTRWVSDFAAKWPEGLWIKLSIAIFCLALADFVRLAINRFSDRPYAGLLKFWWLLLATAMIGGLVLVVLFDMSPAEFRLREPNALSKLFGAKSYYAEVPRSSTEWVMRGHHQLGFQLFVSGFFLAAISLAWSEWRSGLRDAIPTTVYFLLLSSVFACWLFLTQTTIAGIPQRALLILMFVWVRRNLSTIIAMPRDELGTRVLKTKDLLLP